VSSPDPADCRRADSVERTWAERAYAGLLHAYPRAFRDEYAREMRATFRDRLQDVSERRGPLAVVALWIAVLLDTVITAAREHLDALRPDVRDGYRALTGRQALASSSAAVATLALAAGAVTAIFSIVYAVLLAPLPYREPERVVRLWDTNAVLDLPRFASSVPNFLDWQQRARSFEALAALRAADANLTGNGAPERVMGVAASATLWPLLGIRPLAGRTFTADEDRPGGPAVVLVSEGLWRRRFGADPGLAGRMVRVNGAPHTVVGVVPQDVGFTRVVDVWLPLAPDAAQESRGDRQLVVIGRLASGVSVARADEEMKRIAATIEQEHPHPDRGWRVRVVPIREWLIESGLETRLLLLMVAVTLLLLVACANVANLQLARSMSRVREMGLRIALGASRARLMRQLATESALLAAAGGAAGLALAAALVRIVPALLPDSVPRAGGIALNAPVLLVALGTTMLTTMLFGVLPAVLASKTDPQTALTQAGRAVAEGRGRGVQRALVAAQLALAMMLAVGAALLVQSLAKLQEVPLGFDPDGILTARVYRPTSEQRYARDLAFYEEVLREIRALPGVEAAGFASTVPFGESNTSMSIGPIPRPPHIPETGVQASWRIVSPAYFEALGVPLRRGRLFDESDRDQPVILSEGLARRLWPNGEDPIGRTVFISNGQVLTVLGVVDDLRQLGLDQPVTPTMYFHPHFLWPTMTLAVRTAGDPAALAAAVRAAVQRVDPDQPLFEVRPLRTLIQSSAAQPRLNTILLGAFAGVALLLAAVGVAGVVACSVARRTRELAVRLALGASPRRVLRDVMGQGLRTTLVGVIAGLVAAVALAGFLSSVLFGVQPRDPRAFAAAGVTLLLVALFASWLPARRAMAIDAMETLRGE
jgi:putative ABC transport system permease protein